MEILTSKVKIPNQDLLISAYLAQPSTAEKKSAIIVVQEIFGVNEHIQDVTRRFAQEGYIAIAPAIYQRQAPDFAVGYSPEDFTIGRIYKNRRYYKLVRCLLTNHRGLYRIEIMDYFLLAKHL